MAAFRPRDVLRILETHGVQYVVIGNMGGTLYGSPLVTTDIDICPARDTANLHALAGALREMEARIRTSEIPEGIPFSCDAAFLARMQMVNLTTLFGDVDVSFEPSGTAGFADLSSRALQIELSDGITTKVAALEDIIRSKEAANRDKDRLALPTLRLLLQRIKQS